MIMSGTFITHPECCARVDGARQTFTVHVSDPSNPDFIPLPVSSPNPSKSKKKAKEFPPYYCKPCHAPDSALWPYCSSHSMNAVLSCSTSNASALSGVKHPAVFMNELSITGRIFPKARGKELIIAICNSQSRRNFVFRINFGPEAHCFWMPTAWYRQIVSQPPAHRGEKSYAFIIPGEYIDGPAGEHVISIQAAFIQPIWTLVFADHNVIIQFHLMQFSGNFVPGDIHPGSSIWPDLWSHTHGPVYSQEPEATLSALESWHQRIIRENDFTAIYESMKSTQTVFNGSGAQETTDQLLLALIQPLMPAVYVLIAYDEDRMNLATTRFPLPHVSGYRPFRINLDGHTKYLSRISCYSPMV
ncbi:hypothetical protein FB451DRAFT_1361348 [Mycena latifolia]|nr:hypothetical protein FB451DRAFT_1361348 [Mycena latifolia]